MNDDQYVNIFCLILQILQFCILRTLLLFLSYLLKISIQLFLVNKLRVLNSESILSAGFYYLKKI